MCNKLGKKHPSYIDPLFTTASNRKYKDKLGRLIMNKYRARMLTTITELRDIWWCHTQCNDIDQRLKPSKAKLYAKLERYWLK